MKQNKYIENTYVIGNVHGYFAPLKSFFPSFLKMLNWFL